MYGKKVPYYRIMRTSKALHGRFEQPGCGSPQNDRGRQLFCDKQSETVWKGMIYDDTSGYPYLVSALCKLLDEDISDFNFNKKKQTGVWEKRIGDKVLIEASV